MRQPGPIVPVILCGGVGSRLWPASRPARPKPFLDLFEGRTLFQMTLDRVRGPLFAAPVVVTQAELAELARTQMRRSGQDGDLLLEAAPKDTGPAVAAACAWIARHRPEGSVMLLLPSDHLVTDRAAFADAVRAGLTAASGGLIVTFGIVPDRPATGYGYIRPGQPLQDGARAIDQFVEKPDAATAASYLAAGYLWNSGMLLARPDVILAELAQHEPALARAAGALDFEGVAGGRAVLLDPDAFGDDSGTSIDYCLLERTRRGAVVRAAFGWSDVGTWPGLWDASAKDGSGNVAAGPVELIESRNCFVRSSGPRTRVVGLDDVIVVVEDGAVLVTSRTYGGRGSGGGEL